MAYSTDWTVGSLSSSNPGKSTLATMGRRPLAGELVRPADRIGVMAQTSCPAASQRWATRAPK